MPAVRIVRRWDVLPCVVGATRDIRAHKVLALRAFITASAVFISWVFLSEAVYGRPYAVGQIFAWVHICSLVPIHGQA